MQLTVPRLTKDVIEALAEACDAMEQAADRNDTPGFFEANNRFHRVLVHSANGVAPHPVL